MRRRTHGSRAIKYVLIFGFALIAIPTLFALYAPLRLITSSGSIELSDDVLSIYGAGVYHDRDIATQQWFQFSKRSEFPDEQSVSWRPRYWEFSDRVIRAHVQWIPGYQPTSEDWARVARLPTTVIAPNWRWIFRAPLSPYAIVVGILAAWFAWRDRPFPSECCQECGYNVARSGSERCPECGAPFKAVPTAMSRPGRWIRNALDAIWS